MNSRKSKSHDHVGPILTSGWHVADRWRNHLHDNWGRCSPGWFSLHCKCDKSWTKLRTHDLRYHFRTTTKASRALSIGLIHLPLSRVSVWLQTAPLEAFVIYHKWYRKLAARVVSQWPLLCRIYGPNVPGDGHTLAQDDLPGTRSSELM